MEVELALAADPTRRVVFLPLLLLLLLLLLLPLLLLRAGCTACVGPTISVSIKPPPGARADHGEAHAVRTRGDNVPPS